jgi:hypothetical protein
LHVREIDNDQKRDDGGTDGNNVVHAHQPQRNQQAESGFRTICGGAERVQAEDGHAGVRTNLFGALIAGLERLADDKIEDVHG